MKGRQGSCIFLLNVERLRTPESSKSQGAKISIRFNESNAHQKDQVDEILALN